MWVINLTNLFFKPKKFCTCRDCRVWFFFFKLFFYDKFQVLFEVGEEHRVYWTFTANILTGGIALISFTLFYPADCSLTISFLKGLNHANFLFKTYSLSVD